MIKKVLGTYTPQAQSCYNEAAKVEPNLEGSWKLEFTVQPDGSTAEIQVTPQGDANAALEACISSAATRWRFSAIAEPQPSTKTFRFASVSPAQGTLMITGDADDAWLSADGSTFRGGKVPPGSYTWYAKFGDQEQPGAAVEVRAGQTLTLDCRAAFVTCNVKN